MIEIKHKTVRRSTSVLIAFLLLAGMGFAQPFQKRGPYHAPARRPKQTQGPHRNQAQRNRGQQFRPHAPGFFKRLRDFPPGEQERALAADPRFQRLPPERQEQVRERLRRWNAMTPEQREIFRQREEIFESLSPGQRQELRNIFPQYKRLPAERRQAITQAFRKLRDLPADQRQQYLSRPQIQRSFSPEEQNILQGLNRLLPSSENLSGGEPED